MTDSPQRQPQQQVPAEPLSVVPGGQAPGVPPDEAERLADLRGTGALESGPQPELDALVDLAALVAGANIALITLVDETEQVFKAAYGIDAPGTPRDLSFCGHAIAAGTAPMVVRDARLDPRFADNPLVTGPPNIVTYAGVPLVTGGGHAIGTLCVVHDQPLDLDDRQIEALKRLAGQAAGLIELGRRNKVLGETADPRTGLPVREALLDRLAPAGPLPAPASAIAVRVEEIDGGGTRGGLLAEGALRAVARAMGECLPDSAHVARAFGSFLVVLPGVAGAQARAIVSLVRDRLRGAVVVEPNQSVHVGIAAGVATLADGASARVDDLVTAAERALTRADSFGTAHVVIDGRDAEASHARAQRIRRDLGTAVTSGQLVVHYQPIVRLPGREVVAAEALVRWRHPELGLVPPDEFISAAEEMDIIREIDRYVLRRVLHDLAAGWVPGGAAHVNTSPASLVAGMPDAVASDLRDAGVAAPSLTIEVTERLRVDREPQAREVLAALADQGVRIALDDFGAGTTSVAYLRSMPVSCLKLDRSLAADLDGPDARRAAMVVRALAGLAADLDVEVLGEGVETDAQEAALLASGVTLAQGYLYGRPGPLREA